MNTIKFWIKLAKKLIPILSIAIITSAQTPTPTSEPWWQVTEDKVPYLIGLLVAVLSFILGKLAGPTLDSLGSTLKLWVLGRGKHGDFRQRYLTEVVSRCRHLTLLPANVVAARWEYRRRAVELEELYTPLSLGEERGEISPDEVQKITGRQRYRGQPKPKNWVQALSWKVRPPIQPSAGGLGEIIQSHQRLIVRGDPGSGKTTLLRYLTITCARGLRNDRRDGDNSRMHKERLGWCRSRFPILVNLGLFADITSWTKERRLLDAIIDTLPAELRSRYPKKFFQKQLEQGRCLVMFDGFDELGSRVARNRMARLIDDLVNTYDHAKNRFIVSTRIVGYEGQLDACGFTVRTVQDLNPQAIHHLVKSRYKAIAIGEGLGRSDQEQKDLIRRYEERAATLLSELENNEGLKILITNPLLLSLIVLVSLVKVKLPEQRHILYRDCVEVLTERWQEQRRTEAGVHQPDPHRPDDLVLDQKLVLLRDIALALQARRKEGTSQLLMARTEARKLIAARLPDFLAAHLPENKTQQAQECQRRAADLLDSIREESGILVEKGLDRTGEPVVGFSHLTFQEYLAADAIHQQSNALPLLLNNLFNPTWREVLLLYMSMADGGTIIQNCLADSSQPYLLRYLLAGRCLAEEGLLDAQLQRKVLDGLGAYFCHGPEDIKSVKELIERIGGTKHYDWLLENMLGLLTQDELKAFATPPETAQAGSLYRHFQQALVRTTQNPEIAPADRAITADTLDGIGFLPEDLYHFVPIPNKQSPVYIGQYPITNTQYQRFLKAEDFAEREYWLGFPKFSESEKNYERIGDWGDEGWSWLQKNWDENKKLYPRYWHDPRFGIARMGVPVVGITLYEANAYCKWLLAHWDELSEKEQNPDLKPGLIRLPTELEWTAATGGADPADRYPWDKDGEVTQDEAEILRRANVGESGIGHTTPVGMYPLGVSPLGVWDMGGNVFEWQANYRDSDHDVLALRGGSWSLNHLNARLSRRLNGPPYGPWLNYGFRVVAFPS